MTALAVFVAAAAVSSVRAAVTDTPAPLGLPRISFPATSASTAGTDGPATPVSTGTASGPPVTAATTTTTDVDAPTTTHVTQTTSGQDQTSSTPSSTSSPMSGEVSTHDTAGGWVTVRTTPDGVYFEAAGPDQGWSVNIESPGPKEVVVKFERRAGGEAEAAFKASLENGTLHVEISD